jgi:CRP/FNR family cyclic AMP-dependent transcriptional regulator
MAAAAATAPGVKPARLLDLDPDLAIGLAPQAVDGARRHSVVPAVALRSGALDMPAVTAWGLHPFAMLVTSGLLVRDVVLGQTVASELLGPGDVAALDDDEPGLLPMEVRWSAAEPACIALLDDRLLPVMRAWPELGRALLARSTQRAVRVEAQRAISQLARVEDRLVALFGVLAERFARMTPAGLVIAVHLTHAMLGRLVGARRPTVSLALKALADDGSIVRREDGSWLLSHEALDGLRAAAREAPPSRAEARLLELAATPDGTLRGLGDADRRELDDRLSATRLQTQALHARSRTSLARSRALRERVY